MKKKKITAAVMTAAICFTYTAALAESDVRVYVNGERVEGNVILEDGTTYLPVRAVSEAMGANVEWDEDTRSVFVTFTEDDAIAKIVEEVSPSVVAIVGNYTGSGSSGASKYNNPTAHGSGVIYKSNGYIITNAHVVEDITNLTVILYDGTALPGEVLFSDETSDLAIVKVNKIGLRPITMGNYDEVVSGRTVIAIGSPLSLSMRNTVTRGIISGKDVPFSDRYYKFIQTDAAINGGNSGGPLLNTRGELVGINSNGYVGIGIESLSFAIPVDTVEYVIDQFETNGRVMRASFDMSLEQSWEAAMGLPTNKGLTVKLSGIAELAVGDVVMSVNGIEVHNITDWNEALKDTFNGSTAAITYMHGSETKETVIRSMV